MKPFYFALALASFAMPLAVRPVEAQQVVPLRPAKTILVFIGGQVRKPNAYQVPVDATWNSLLALAGGPTDNAGLSQVMVQRPRGMTLTIDLGTTLNKTQIDFVLQDGDSVIVPRNENRVLVMGEVQHPGFYAIPEGRTLSVAEALVLAGGKRKGGDTKIKLIRKQTTPKAGQSTTPRITEDVKLSQTLQSGDVIFVSETKKPQKPRGKLYLLPAARFHFLDSGPVK